MSDPNPKRSTVKRGVLRKKSAPDAVAFLNAVCAAGAQSPVVQASPALLGALAALQASTSTLSTDSNAKATAAQSLRTAAATLRGSTTDASSKLAVYEAMVEDAADGSAVVISQCGLLSRALKTPAAALGAVSEVHAELGKKERQSIVSWPLAKGATSYALQVNWTPDGTGAWTALPSGSSHRRVITAPASGAQFLVCVAALASDGTQSAWSTPILATAA